MNPLLLGPLLEMGKDLIGRLIPNKDEARKAESEFLKMAMDGELKQVIAQLEINAKEAAHPSIWVAGWRPYFGWVGGTGIAYQVLIRPLLSWYSAMNDIPIPPDIDTDTLMVVVGGLLGIGGLRSFEKRTGVAK